MTTPRAGTAQQLLLLAGIQWGCHVHNISTGMSVDNNWPAKCEPSPEFHRHPWDEGLRLCWRLFCPIATEIVWPGERTMSESSNGEANAAAPAGACLDDLPRDDAASGACRRAVHAHRGLHYHHAARAHLPVRDGAVPWQFGLVVSAYTKSSAGIAGLVAARFLDRFDRKTALLWLYGGFVAGTWLCAAVPDFSFLLVLRGWSREPSAGWSRLSCWPSSAMPLPMSAAARRWASSCRRFPWRPSPEYRWGCNWPNGIPGTGRCPSSPRVPRVFWVLRTATDR